MELTVLGSGTAALQMERGPAGYALKAAGEIVLLDGGTGTLLKGLQAGISYRDVDKLFYTHLHPDHVMDLVPFLFATRHTPGFVRTRKLEIYGPAGFRFFFERLIDLFGSAMLQDEYELQVLELDETDIAFAAFNVRSARMAHSENAVGFRFEAGGRSFVYSGDTDVCDGIVSLAEGADLLLIECSFADKQKVAGHLTPSEVGDIASKAGAQKVLLTHIYPPFQADEILSAVRKRYSGEVAIATDLMKVTI